MPFLLLELDQLHNDLIEFRRSILQNLEVGLGRFEEFFLRCEIFLCFVQVRPKLLVLRHIWNSCRFAWVTITFAFLLVTSTRTPRTPFRIASWTEHWMPTWRMTIRLPFGLISNFVFGFPASLSSLRPFLKWGQRTKSAAFEMSMPRRRRQGRMRNTIRPRRIRKAAKVVPKKRRRNGGPRRRHDAAKADIRRRAKFPLAFREEHLFRLGGPPQSRDGIAIHRQEAIAGPYAEREYLGRNSLDCNFTAADSALLRP
mmetsp:Transcript_5755/g.16599  ORF Transcript_5755/g.16599 Transcript_5755/m.16599 type:complete len:256 (+) Transcript_5755:1743-2510(+)